MTRSRVGARPVDLLENYRRFGDAESSAAVLSGNQRRQPTRLRECGDEFLRITLRLLESLPVSAVEPGAELSDALSILGELSRAWIDVGGHGRSRNAFAMSSHDSMPRAELTARSATSAPNRGSTSAMNFSSSASVETGFSGLPRGKSLTPLSVVPSRSVTFTLVGHAAGYFAVRSSATVTVVRFRSAAISWSRTPLSLNLSGENCASPAAPSSKPTATPYAMLNFA